MIINDNQWYLTNLVDEIFQRYKWYGWYKAYLNAMLSNWNIILQYSAVFLPKVLFAQALWRFDFVFFVDK